MFGILFIVVALGVATWYFVIKPHSYWRKLGVKQSKPWPFFGDSWHSTLKQTPINDFISILYNMHPGSRYMGLYTFNTPVLLLRDPELIKQITVKDFEHFTDHPPFVDPESDPLWSNSLLSLKGERWKNIRVTLSPAFTSSKIKNIYILMLGTVENFVKHFLEKDDDIIEVEIKDAYSRFTNDVIATTAFGVEVNSLKDTKNSFYEMGKKLTNFGGLENMIKFIGILAFPTLFKYLGIPLLNKQASKYFSKVIDDTIRVREEQNIIRPDMLNLMLEAKKNYAGDGSSKSSVKMTNQEITSQAMIFFFGGFDTVSTISSFGSYELALNKDVQDRLRQEIYATQKNGKVTYDELLGMKYMDMVISEILRKWPAFPFLDRICTKPYTIEPVNEGESPVPITTNQEIWIPIYGIQRDPKYFPDPDKFDPERFSDENKNNILPYTYMPFGSGPRICIANRFALLEMKALLFNLLLNFELVPTKKTQIPLVFPKDFNVVPDGGIWIGLKRLRN